MGQLFIELVNIAGILVDTRQQGPHISEAQGDVRIPGNASNEADVAAALAVFERDLHVFVENAWGLYGAADAARKLGDRKKWKDFEARAKVAWSHADVKFQSPCPQLFVGISEK